jgi:N-acetylneuraminate synthase/N,N'-diacetyllegionaminate synthase
MATLIIAEAGVNHNGDLDMARKLIDAAADAGADIVKFQTFNPEKLVSAAAKKAEYQVTNTGDAAESQLDMLRRLMLSQQAHDELIAYAKSREIQFFSTAFDLESLEFLNKLNLPLFKIPSGEATNYPYLRQMASYGKPVILSTGMCTIGEVEQAVQVLIDGGLLREQITVLHCNTEYPTPMQDVNLRAMVNLGKALGVAYGYSDHTLGIEIPIAAVALGAVCIEKHFTLDKTLPGPDHVASLEPHELKQMVSAIRNVEAALGNGIKAPSASERKNVGIARKSIHAARALAAGETLTEDTLEMLRPGDGLSPMLLPQLLGRTVAHALPAGHKLTWSDFA